MAVAYGGTNVSDIGGAATSPTLSITVSGTNPVLIVCIGLDSTTATISSITWSLGSGTAVNVKSVRSGTAFSNIWAVPAPSAGAGTLTINKSAAVNHQLDGILFTGADQTTPCPTADAVSSTTTAASETKTPTNLAASDGSVGCGINTVSNNPGGITPNQRYLNGSSSVNMQTGDATGTTGVTFAYDSPDIGAGSVGKVVVRIAAAGAAATVTYPELERLTRGMGRGMPGRVLAPSRRILVPVLWTPANDVLYRQAA